MAVRIDSQARAKRNNRQKYKQVKVYKQTVHFQIKYLSL